jgi:hypothetical protein
MSPEADAWLVDGSQGISSRTIFDHLVLGREAGTSFARPGHGAPGDPDDFQRCERLLRQVPGLRERLPELDSCHCDGPSWAALVARWDEIVETIDRECPGWMLGDGWAAAKCSGAREGYALMCAITDPIRFGSETRR